MELSSQIGLMQSKKLISRERNLVGQGEFQEQFMPQPHGQTSLGQGGDMIWGTVFFFAQICLKRGDFFLMGLVFFLSVNMIF